VRRGSAYFALEREPYNREEVIVSRPALGSSGTSRRVPLQGFVGQRAWKSLLGGGLLLIDAQVSGGDEMQPSFKIDDSSFKCIREMTPVRHFYVDNLLGNVAATVAVAEEGKGDYPEGSVLQLMPNEVMIKHQKGFNPVTRDWEFFFIDVSPEGSKIYRRGFVEVNNRLGMNCFACHVEARPEFDFVCEQDHGCDPIPVAGRELEGLVGRRAAVSHAGLRADASPAGTAQDGRGYGVPVRHRWHSHRFGAGDRCGGRARRSPRRRRIHDSPVSTRRADRRVAPRHSACVARFGGKSLPGHRSARLGL